MGADVAVGAAGGGTAVGGRAVDATGADVAGAAVGTAGTGVGGGAGVGAGAAHAARTAISAAIKAILPSVSIFSSGFCRRYNASFFWIALVSLVCSVVPPFAQPFAVQNTKWIVVPA